MSWTPQHTFATNERVRAAWIKSMQDNLVSLEHPASDYRRRLETNVVVSNATTSASFVDASADYLQGKFTIATPRSIFITANVVAYTSAGDTEGELGLMIDGVDQSGGHGIAVVEWMDQALLYPIAWIAENMAAGEHHIKLRHRRTAGTGTMNVYAFSRHWFYTVEI